MLEVEGYFKWSKGCQEAEKDNLIDSSQPRTLSQVTYKKIER